MVHTKSETSRISYSELMWKDNVSFTSIDRQLIEQFRDRAFTYESFIKWGEFMDCLPNVWNMVMVDKDGVTRVFVYGHFNPLEKEMEVKRVSIHPDLMTVFGGFMFEFDKRIKALAKRFGVLHVYCVTRYWRHFLRKMPGILKESDVKILEVL